MNDTIFSYANIDQLEPKYPMEILNKLENYQNLETKDNLDFEVFCCLLSALGIKPIDIYKKNVTLYYSMVDKWIPFFIKYWIALQSLFEIPHLRSTQGTHEWALDVFKIITRRQNCYEIKQFGREKFKIFSPANEWFKNQRFPEYENMTDLPFNI